MNRSLSNRRKLENVVGGGRLTQKTDRPIVSIPMNIELCMWLKVEMLATRFVRPG